MTHAASKPRQRATTYNLLTTTEESLTLKTLASLAAEMPLWDLPSDSLGADRLLRRLSNVFLQIVSILERHEARLGASEDLQVMIVPEPKTAGRKSSKARSAR